MDIIYRYNPFVAIDPRQLATGDQAERALLEGNRRHAAVIARIRDGIMAGEGAEPVVVEASPLALGLSFAPGHPVVQAPFALVLGCSDARAPIELIFNQAHNQLFVVRVAGNVLGTECLGSLEYAARNLASALRLVVVLGHSGCGAVGAAVGLYLDPTSYSAIAQTHSLRSIVDRITVVVRIADQALHTRVGPDVADEPGYRTALWELAVALNAALTARDVARELGPTLGDRTRVVFGVYDIASQLVAAVPGDDHCFVPAPRDADEFDALCGRLVASIQARGILRPPVAGD